MGAVTFSIDTNLVELLKKVLPLKVFVETGTFKGDTLASIRQSFEKLYSVELSAEYYELARDRFRDDPAIQIIHGDSGEKLAGIVSSLAGESSLFWLDSHWCVAKDTAGEFSQCPLVNELKAIGSLNGESVIVIDDARLLLAPPPVPHEWSQWPNFDTVIDTLRSLSQKHLFLTLNDCIVFFPEKIKEDVWNYAHNNGVDWLKAIDKARDYDILLAQLSDKENLIKLQNAQIVMQKEELEEKENIIKTQSYQTADMSLIQTILMNRTIQRYFYPRLGAFYQHPPKNIEIPESYYSPRPLANPPMISIVTPSFKHGAFIERTIKSVIDQKYPNLEYIVQDGGSTDETTDILKKYASQISHWESVKDKGQSNALNLGFQRAHGEIMAYLNSDDLLLPGTLNYVAAYFAERPDVDVVYGHRVIVQGDDLEIGRWVMPRHRDYALNWGDYLPQETMFWRKSLWEKSGGCIDETYNFAMDWELICRFRKAGAKIVRLPRFLGAFRVHSAQKTTSQMAKVGAEEMRRIRHMIHKRPVTNREIAWKLKPYMLEHIILQKLYRFGLLKY